MPRSTKNKVNNDNQTALTNEQQSASDKTKSSDSSTLEQKKYETLQSSISTTVDKEVEERVANTTKPKPPPTAQKPTNLKGFITSARQATSAQIAKSTGAIPKQNISGESVATINAEELRTLNKNNSTDLQYVAIASSTSDSTEGIEHSGSRIAELRHLDEQEIQGQVQTPSVSKTEQKSLVQNSFTHESSDESEQEHHYENVEFQEKLITFMM